MVTEDLIPRVKEAVENKNRVRIKEIFSQLYPADMVELVAQLSSEELKFIIPIISLEKLAFSFSDLDAETRNVLLNFLTPQQVKTVLNQMYSDDIADLLGELTIGQSKELLKLMKNKDAQQIQKLLGYDEESAGGIMTTEYLAVKDDKTVGEALSKIRDIATRAEMIYYIYIINSNKELLGVISMRELLTADPSQKLKEVMHRKVIKVQVDVDQEKVANQMSKYDLLAIPVVNNHNQLLGIITVDDALDVIEEEATEDIYKMAATSEFEITAAKEGIISGVLKRLPWLLILLFASMLSGTVIGSFSKSLSEVVALAFFIPTLTGTGGNAGTQSLAIVVRGLATGDLDRERMLAHLFRELRVGAVTALACGVIISIIAFFWQGTYFIGLVVGLAMFFTIVTATLVGTTTPFIIDYLGADPAVAAGPFITTLIDVSGLFIYFSLAKVLLQYLSK
ncbi:MAG: magnesium transporter [Bacillota bacterium]